MKQNNLETMIKVPTNLWNGNDLTDSQKRNLTRFTMKEFKKSKRHRKTPKQLIDMVLGIEYAKKVAAYEKKLKNRKL
tara:strand:- start:417 stop:647 length:231 start_codon:yes stop_codon:yes gene_type:complete